MLHHEESASSAAQERVAADELARAIAAIEGRRQQQAGRLAGTLSIGEAVRELDLDATPDEVWAEVQAQRARRHSASGPAPSSQTPSSSPPPSVTPPPPLPHALGAALRDAATAAAPGLRQAAQAAAPSLKQGIDAVSRSLAAQNAAKTLPRRESAKQGLTVFAVVCAMLGIMAGTGVLGYWHTPHPAAWRTLSTIPDGHLVVADTATVLQIQKGNTAVQVRDTDDLANNWTLVRHDKHWYVRGYVRNDAEVGAGGVKMYTDNNAGVLHGVEEKDVTLRLDTLHVDDTNAGDNWQEIDASDVHPDVYTHENW